MGMSTHVVGFRPPDEKWHSMKKIWDSCTEAGIDIPEEVGKFFDWETPDEAGVEIDLEKTSACRKYNEDMRDGFEIVVAELPPDVKIIRFVNSY